MNKNDWHACRAYNLYNTQVVFGVADCSWLPKPCPMRFVAFDYQNTGIADQTEEEPLIKAEICLALSQEKDNRNWSQWQWGGSSKSWSCACSSSIFGVSNCQILFHGFDLAVFQDLHTFTMSRHHGWCQVFYNERLKVLAWVSSERLDFWIASMAKMQDLYYYVLFATFSNMTKAYLFASHVLLFVILKPSDVPTLYVNFCQFTSSCISPSVVLSQLLAIGLCQWHHQRCQDLGRQSLKCWYNLVHVSTWWIGL